MKHMIGVFTVPGTTEDAIVDGQFLRNSMDWVMWILSGFLESKYCASKRIEPDD
jgi:hypothetical protein